MADGLSVHCPECGAGLKLKDRSRVGKQVRCPGCRAAFVVPAPAESADTTDLLDDDLWVDEEPGESGVGPSPRRAPARRPRRSPAGPPRSAPRGGSRVSRASAAPSRPLGMNPVVLCCAAGTALLLGAAILFAVLRGMRHDPSAEQERLARSAEQAQQRFVAPGVPRPAGNGAPPQISDEMAEMYAQVSREEAATFAREFVTAVSNRDAAAVDRLIYYDFLLYQAASGVNANQSIRQAFTDGYKQSPNRHVLLNHIARALEAGGTIEPVRIHVHRAVTNEGVSLARRVLMRLLDADGGVAYFDLSLERHTDGSIRANDWFDVGAGELFSEALKRSFIMVVGSRTTNPQVSQEQRELTESAARILQIRSLAAAGQAREALQIIDGLPASVRNSKNILLMRVGLAKSLGVDECLLAMQEFRQRFLADPALDLAAIDFHTSNGEFDKALEAIDRLDAAIGGDPALNVIRASLKIGQKDLDAARALLNEAISREAAVEHALWELAVVSVAEEKFGEAVERLSDIERRFGIRRPNFIEAPEFAALAGTAEYEQWQQSRGQAAPSPDAASP